MRKLELQFKITGIAGQRPTAPPGGRFQRDARGRSLPFEAVVEQCAISARAQW